MNAGLIKNTALANKPRIRKMSKKKELFNFNKAMVLLLIIAVFAIIKSAIAPQASSLEQDADIAIATLTGVHEEIGLLSSNEIDTEKLVMNENSKKENMNLMSELSHSEYRILSMIAEQKTSKIIGEELFISEKTVRNHRYNISKKLNLDTNNNSLLKWAIANFSK